MLRGPFPLLPHCSFFPRNSLAISQIANHQAYLYLLILHHKFSLESLCLSKVVCCLERHLSTIRSLSQPLHPRQKPTVSLAGRSVQQISTSKRDRKSTRLNSSH